MESGPKSTCRWGLDELHRQLAEGNNAPETRRWLKHVLFNCHYTLVPCGYQPPDPICVCGVELSRHNTDPPHNFVDAAHYRGGG